MIGYSICSLCLFAVQCTMFANIANIGRMPRDGPTGQDHLGLPGVVLLFQELTSFFAHVMQCVVTISGGR
jgi:hypothetical protein